ncbi:MAG: type I-E CRISPR-associated protein Cas5/CasD [Methanoregula sp.]
MRDYLIFRLYGMMASWGDIAVGEFRPTFDRPSKSAIMGLISAALGIRRDEEERLRDLARGYHMALRIDAPGTLLRDYHTAQVPPSGKGRAKTVFPTRKAELSVPKEDLNTILSSRDYRCDALYTVCLWSRTATPPYPLAMVKDRLERPVFGLYLGRKSCPLSLPLEAQVVPADTISGALLSARFSDAAFLHRLGPATDARVFWEGDDAGLDRVHTVERRDEPLSRRRWQFGNRTEHYAMMPKSTGD